VHTRGRFLSGLVTIVIALAGVGTAGALPAAATPGNVDYVALGDSYAAGQGAPPYDLDAACKRSSKGYPARLASKRIVTVNVACSGAKVQPRPDVLGTQLSALKPETRLVTLTVGAANLGLSAVAAACLPGPSQQCNIAIGSAQGLLGDCTGVSPLSDLLIDLYREVAKAAPGARIVVTGYPLLFEPPPANPDLNSGIITAINKATTDLNCVIERAVAAANADDINIHYVDVTEEFAGHGIGCSDPDNSTNCLFINPPEVGLPEAFHPTAAGYAAYAEAIKTKLPGGWFDKSSV
jgi:lysophospholipase L1-like esterase